MKSSLDRRSVLKLLASLPVVGVLQSAYAEATASDRITRYFQSLSRPGGGYAWSDNPVSALTPSYAAVCSYQLLGSTPPHKAELAQFINGAYPMNASRRTDRPLRRFDYEQMQSLVYLGSSIEEYRSEVEAWTKPSTYTKYYEMREYPVFQHEVSAVLCRKLLALGPTDDWREYILSRRRANGSFNNTPGSDGSDGHISNTLWGLLAMQALVLPIDNVEQTVQWISACRQPNGGYTYSPHASIAATDHVVYTWAALKALHLLNAKIEAQKQTKQYLESLWNPDGGFGDRPGRASNPSATLEGLEGLTILASASNARPAGISRPRYAASSLQGLKVFSLQVEAPGIGSPREAAEMAKALRIHLWGAKNCEPGWIARAQQIAQEENIPVTFFVSNEEYGSYISVAGLGTYSHLADVIAPYGSNFGLPMSDKAWQPTPWDQFVEQRLAPLRNATGSDVWQFNENEELSRILLDQAIYEGTFSSISSFHFGSEMFLNTEPFLNRYRDVMPYVGLQDAHTQTWWWMEYLVAYRTLFLAREPTWESWNEALRKNWVVNVRHDEKVGFKTQVVGASNEVRKYVMDRDDEWRWWNIQEPEELVRPEASLVVLTPADIFEAGKPERGVALRIRCWFDTEPFGVPKIPVVELESLLVDGQRVSPQLVQVPPAGPNRGDIYHIWNIPYAPKGPHTATANIKNLRTRETGKVERSFTV